jgi:hypothetical protein
MKSELYVTLRRLTLCAAITMMIWMLAGCAVNPALSGSASGFAPFVLVVWLFVVSTVSLLTGCGGNNNSGNFTPNTFTGATNGGSTSGGGNTSSGTTTSGNQQVPTKLAFIAPPQLPATGPQALTTLPNFQVGIEDANGKIVTSDNAPITILAASAPTGGGIKGTTTVIASSGVATFSGLQLTLAGSYTVQATSPGLQPASLTFQVAPLPLGFHGRRDFMVLLGPGSSAVTADFDADGKTDVAISGGAGDQNVYVFFGNGDGTFAEPPLAVPTGINAAHTGAGRMVAAHLQGDTAPPDIFVGPVASAVGVTASKGAVLIPTGRAFTHQAQALGASAAILGGVATANLEGDGVSRDVAIATSSHYDLSPGFSNSKGTTSVIVLHGDGVHPTLTPVSIATFNGGASGLTIGDFNGDHNLDIALANPYSSKGVQLNMIRMLLGNGSANEHSNTATFNTTGYFQLGNKKPYALASGDFNGDGLSDVVVSTIEAYLSGSGYGTQLKLLLGTSGVGPVLAPAGSFKTNDIATDVAVTDLNGDGQLDVIAHYTAHATYNDNVDDVLTLLGTGTGQLQSPARYARGGSTDDRGNVFFDSANSLALGDLNGDGVSDVISVNYAGYGGNNFSVFVANHDTAGTLLAAPEIATANRNTSITMADLNNDGQLDLIWIATPTTTHAAEVYVALGNGDGTFAAPRAFDAGQPHWLGHLYQLIAADFNKDGKLDVFVGQIAKNNGSSGNISVLLGNGDGTLGAALPNALTNRNTERWAAADMNNDGILDLVDTANSGPGTEVALGNGDGTFGVSTNIARLAGNDLKVADVNGDGVNDIVVCTSNQVNVLMGAVSGGQWSPSANFQTALAHTRGDSLAVGDFDGDGKLDVAVSGNRYISSSFSLLPATQALKGKGDGTFSPLSTATVGMLPSETFAMDVNADGVLDLVVFNENSHDISILLGNGDGTFQPQQQWGVGSGEKLAGGLAVGSIRGNGKIDAVSADNTHSLTLLLHD